MSDQTQNPLLGRVRLPGETFRLPSLGLFYKDGELDESVSNGEVHIMPMTTLDEIVFKSSDKLFSGEAIVEVFQRCIPQIHKPMKLLAKDVDYLLTALRLVSYGPVLEVTYRHTCEEAKEHAYKTELRPYLQKAKPIDPTTLEQNFTHTLPNGQVVHLRPALFDSVVRMSQTTDYNEEQLTPTVIRDIMLDVLGSMIVDVDGTSDQGMVQEWLAELPVGWIRDLTAVAGKNGEFGVNTTIHTECQDCGQAIGIEVSTNPLSFFM